MYYCAFEITQIRILRKEVVVEAENSEEAKEIAEALYRKGEIVLDAGDFIGEPTITCN